MLLSINQPAYLPWPGYFDRIRASDLHIQLDHVQFEKNSLVNRNKIRTSSGWSWLTVPVITKGQFGRLPINQLKISPSISWSRKHYRSLLTNYSRAPYSSPHLDFFQDLYRQEWEYLAYLLNVSNKYLLQVFNISTPIINSSDLDPQKSKSELILELCQKVGATTYLSGPFGRNYLDLSKFDAHGITVKYHDYIPPTYSQQFSGFESSMSIIDLLFNQGPISL